MICWVLAMEMLQGVWKQHLRPCVVMGYDVKIFLPSPPNYVTRSPGCVILNGRLVSDWIPQSSLGTLLRRLNSTVLKVILKVKVKGKATFFNVSSSFSNETGMNGSWRCALHLPLPSSSTPRPPPLPYLPPSLSPSIPRCNHENAIVAFLNTEEGRFEVESWSLYSNLLQKMRTLITLTCSREILG